MINITNFREGSDGLFRFDFNDSIGISGDTYSFPFTADTVIVTNLSNVNITANGSTVFPNQQLKIVSRLSDIVISASSGMASFRIEGVKNSDDPQPVTITGSLAKLSTDPFPAGEEGWDLLEYNTSDGSTNVYKYISGAWRLI